MNKGHGESVYITHLLSVSFVNYAAREVKSPANKYEG
jgi:hypothetical protein